MFLQYLITHNLWLKEHISNFTSCQLHLGDYNLNTNSYPQIRFIKVREPSVNSINFYRVDDNRGDTKTPSGVYTKQALQQCLKSTVTSSYDFDIYDLTKSRRTPCWTRVLRSSTLAGDSILLKTPRTSSNGLIAHCLKPALC